ncbi:hypothetical protein FHX42_005321 [Saccharopolyspora lacisalsi]|uniref:Uncharacterized protein n=1 Tax=Halosaccharopolyspora lacisalsi TaxID=1000566 RepID=A0A839E4B5_9PSEU|nr:hypothetical protein [Halosaccharopolyspora lacisalsi]MBA8827880.1 hypothetical protein [Halosaccharopolyspora lacisalsi]MBA8827914.1 hypothetical protein [Halosaccharopolyspora lacisalsi]
MDDAATNTVSVPYGDARFVAAALHGLTQMITRYPVSTPENRAVTSINIALLSRAAYVIDHAIRRDCDTDGTTPSEVADWRHELRSIYDNTPTYTESELPEFINDQTVPGRVETYNQHCYSAYPDGDYGTPDEARAFAYKILAAANYHEYLTSSQAGA